MGFLTKIREISTKGILIIAKGLGLIDPRLASFFSGGPTHAGESVSVSSAMQLDVVWSCVRLIAETLATLPLFTYKRDENGNCIIDNAHPLYRILHDHPNIDMTAVDFWTATVSALLLQGNSYAAISRRKDEGETASLPGPDNPIIALFPMRPEFITVRRNENGSLAYHYSHQGFVGKLEEWQVLHIKGYSLDGLTGLSPIAQARHTLASAIAAEKATGAFFRNEMRPSAVIESPNFLSPPNREQMKEKIEGWRGVINAGMIPLLEGGFKFTPISMKPEDAQLLQTRGLHVEQICRWFAVPPPMVGHSEKSTSWGTGLEQMNLWFLTYCLRPHLKRIEQAISKALFTAEEKLTHYVEFNVEGLLRVDSATRAALYRTQISFALATPNEIRALENMPPLLNGDDLLIMSNMIPLKMIGNKPMSISSDPQSAIDAAAQAKSGVGETADNPFGIQNIRSGLLTFDQESLKFNEHHDGRG